MLNLVCKQKQNKGTTLMKKIRPSEERINRNKRILEGKEFTGMEDLVVKNS